MSREQYKYQIKFKNDGITSNAVMEFSEAVIIGDKIRHPTTGEAYSVMEKLFDVSEISLDAMIMPTY